MNSNPVQHYKIVPSQVIAWIKIGITFAAFLLVVSSSVDVQFKVLLSLLLVLDFYRKRDNEVQKNKITQFEVRENALFIKRENDNKLQSVTQFNIKQSRLFAEIKIQLEDEVRYELLYQDNFKSKQQFCSLLQSLRTIQRKLNANPDPVI